MGEIIKYAQQYQANHIYQIRYQKSKDKDRYFRQHETELLLHGGAENMLRQWGLSPKNVDLSKLQSKYKALISQREATSHQRSIDLIYASFRMIKQNDKKFMPFPSKCYSIA